MLLFDLTACQPSSSSKRHGGGKYAEILFRCIVKRKFPMCCYYDSRRWINPEIVDIINNNNINLFDISTTSLDCIVEQNGVELLYSALPGNLINREKFPCRILFTWHGLRHEEVPMDLFFLKYQHNSVREIISFFIKRYFPRIGLRKKIATHRKAILNENVDFVMVSNHSRCSLMSYYPESKGVDVKVFYSPSTSLKKKERLNSKYNDDFFLIVSANRWVKNGLRALIAFDRLFSMGYLEGYRVRITGAKDSNIYKYKIQNPQRFVFMGYVEDNELEQLYHDAYCLVYPSLNEGFGYPPLEAMQFGTPVLASAITSIPEVCGDAAIYFNPFSIQEIMARILWISESKIYNEYKIRSKERFDYISSLQEKDLESLADYICEKSLRE